MHHLIYLASGRGERFGSNKLLAEFRGKPLYRWGLETLKKTAESRGNVDIFVVSRYAAVRKDAEALGLCAVDCPESVLGQSYSIRAGIRAVPEIREGNFLTFFVADQPLLRPESLCKLLDAPDVPTARLCCAGIPGNPVRFSARLVPELLALTGDRGGGAVLRTHPALPVEIKDPRELADIDTVEDLTEAEKSLP